MKYTSNRKQRKAFSTILKMKTKARKMRTYNPTKGLILWKKALKKSRHFFLSL